MPTTPQKAAGWRIDPAIHLDKHWHGSYVVSAKDGGLIGLVLVDGGDADVALLPDLDKAEP